MLSSGLKITHSFFSSSGALGETEQKAIQKNLPKEILDMMTEQKVEFIKCEPVSSRQSNVLYKLDASCFIWLRVMGNHTVYLDLLQSKTVFGVEPVNMYTVEWKNGHSENLSYMGFLANRKSSVLSPNVIPQDVIDAIYVERFREVLLNHSDSNISMAKTLKKFVDEGKIDKSCLDMEYIDKCLEPLKSPGPAQGEIVRR